jgi:hypothetical protein
LVTERLKPPSKKPQVTPPVFSRSPMFLPDMLKLALVEEQTSPPGSASLMSVAALAVGDDGGGDVGRG